MAEHSNSLDALKRDRFGKGAARKLRAAGQTPAVLYGHGSDPLHLSVATHPLSLIVRQPNALITLKLDGGEQLALVKDVQKDPVRQAIEHVDLLIVKQGETVEVEVPVVVEGEPFPGTTAMQELNHVLVSAPATAIPEHFQVNVDGLEEGAQVLVKDLAVDGKTEVLTDGEELVVNVIVPIVDTESDADETPAEPESDTASDADEAAAE